MGFKTPDLNPIEHVWDFLGQKVRSRLPKIWDSWLTSYLKNGNRLIKIIWIILLKGILSQLVKSALAHYPAIKSNFQGVAICLESSEHIAIHFIHHCWHFAPRPEDQIFRHAKMRPKRAPSLHENESYEKSNQVEIARLSISKPLFFHHFWITEIEIRLTRLSFGTLVTSKEPES